MDATKYQKPHALHPKMRKQLEKEEKKTGVKMIQEQPKQKVKDASNLKGMRDIIIQEKPKAKEVLKYFEAILEEHDKKRKEQE